VLLRRLLYWLVDLVNSSDISDFTCVGCEVLYAKVLDSEIQIVRAKSLRRKKDLYVGGMAVGMEDEGEFERQWVCSLSESLLTSA
jgi:hypothetical protein